MATAAKGTRRLRMLRVAGATRSRGTSALRPRATEHEADTATAYDLASVAADMGDDLLALAELMATLSDWLATCHAMMPGVWRPGWSMPAVTMRLVMTNEDMRKGRKTGSPVSGPVLASSFSTKGGLGGGVGRTRVKRRVDHLFGVPQLGRHPRNLARLVVCDELLRALQAARAGEEGAAMTS